MNRKENVNLKNVLSMVVFTMLLGAFVGLVLWCFLRSVGLCTTLIWETIPENTVGKWIVVPLCALGGLIAGILHKRFGDYPEDLETVMGKIKKNKHYDYHPMFVMLVCAFLPLVLGASVGPEAGLTGVIAGLCYWIGDNVKYAKKNTDFYSQIGEAVTLGQLFRSPLFGILAVEEEPQGLQAEADQLPRLWKIALYGLSTLASFGVISLLNNLLGKAMAGFPSFETVTIGTADYFLVIVYVLAGCLLFLFFELCEKTFKDVSRHVPVILQETLCGLVIGLMGLLVPIVLFSGEEQMAELMEDFGSYAPFFLIGVCLLKVVMTAFCIKFGLKGGHFFPLIFACTCMGYGLAMLFFGEPAPHVVFAAGIVTAAALGAQMRKPLAVSVLMLLCFPVQFLFWIFVSAAIGGGLAQVIRQKKRENRRLHGKKFSSSSQDTV